MPCDKCKGGLETRYCPECGKRANMNGPSGLLDWLNDNATRLGAMIKKEPDKRTKEREAQLARWQSWAKWVGTQIK